MSKLVLIFLTYFTLLSYTLFTSYSEGQISFGGGGGGGGVSGWPSVSTNKIITWANSLANAVRIGDGSNPICIYTDATKGPQIRPCTDSNTRTLIPTNFTWSLYDEEADTDVLTVDPDAASVNLVYSFSANYRPKKSIWFGAASLSVDGTNCATPAEATPVASGAKLYTIICADNDSSRMYGSVIMPDGWDGGTLTFEALVVQTAADTNVIEYQVAAQCKGDTESLVATSSYGTEVVWSDTMSGSGKANFSTSGSVTPSGTCAAGDFLAFYVDIGATTTTTSMATVHIIGFKVEYSRQYLSD